MKYSKRKWLRHYGPNVFNLMTELVGEEAADDLFVKMWLSLSSQDKLDKDQIHLYALRYLETALNRDEQETTDLLMGEYLELMKEDNQELLTILHQYLEHDDQMVDAQHLSQRRLLLAALSHKRTQSAGLGELGDL